MLACGPVAAMQRSRCTPERDDANAMRQVTLTSVPSETDAAQRASGEAYRLVGAGDGQQRGSRPQAAHGMHAGARAIRRRGPGDENVAILAWHLRSAPGSPTPPARAPAARGPAGAGGGRVRPRGLRQDEPARGVGRTRRACLQLDQARAPPRARSGAAGGDHARARRARAARQRASGGLRERGARAAPSPRTSCSMRSPRASPRSASANSQRCS